MPLEKKSPVIVLPDADVKRMWEFGCVARSRELVDQ